MSTHVVVTSLSAHVTLRVGEMSAQFYVNREGLVPPVYVYSGGIGYQLRAFPPSLDDIPAGLREDVEKEVRKYQAKFLLKGDT
jgi:hypothetical protein